MEKLRIEDVIQIPTRVQECTGAVGWSVVEDTLGTRLPEDYKVFINRFGTGTINDFLTILNPFSSHKYVSLQFRIDLDRRAYLTSKAAFPKEYPFDFYPEQGGLLPCGITDNGNVLFWKTGSDPEQWPIVIYESRGPKYFIFDGNITGFLVGVLLGSVRCDVFPDDFFELEPSFEPVSANK